MTCVYKEYKVKTKMVQEQLLQLKMKFLLGYFYWVFIGFFIGLLFSGGDWALVGGVNWGWIFPGGGMSKFSVGGGGGLTHPPVGKTLINFDNSTGTQCTTLPTNIKSLFWAL